MKFDDIEALRGRGEDDDGPTSLDLDRLAAGLKDAELEARVDADPALRNTLARRRQGLDAVDGLDARALKARIVAAVEPPQAEAARGPSWAWLRSPWIWTALAVAAAVAMFALRPRPDPGPAVRIKGALKLMVFRQVDGGATEAISGAVFRPGEHLKFKVSLPAPGRVRIVGIDAAGALYTAWPLPEHADAETTLPAGDARELPGAIALDDAPGPERLHLVLCPPDVEPVCRSAGAGAPPVCPEGCATTPFTLNKSP